MKSGTEGRTAEGPKGLQNLLQTSVRAQLKTNAANLVLPTKYYIFAGMLPIFESKTACRKTYKKVSMSALHPSGKHPPPPSQRRQCCWSSTPGSDRFQMRALTKEEPQHLFTNKLSSGILRTACFFFLTMLPPIHLQKTGRQEGPAESLLVRLGSAVV